MEILLGKNKSGKTKYIFNKIDEDIEKNKKCLLIVPSQMRLEIEKKYFEEQNKDGIMEFDITSFEKMVNNYFSSVKLDMKKTITKLDKSVITRKIISNNQNVFKIYKKAKNTQGFFASIDILIDLFRKENVTVKDLENLELEDKYLECKIKEIANIYKIYLSEVESKYIDFAKEYDMFCEYLKNSDSLDDTNIYIDGFNNFSKWEQDIIALLLSKGLNVCISLVTDVKSIEEANLNLEDNMYSVANYTYLKLNKMCNDVGNILTKKCFEEISGLQNFQIEFLANNLYKIKKEKYTKDVENVHILTTTNPYTELILIAKNIKENIMKGYRYNDFCIYTGEVQKYEFAIKKIFYEYEIPYYIDVPENINKNSLVVYIVSLLNICSKNYQIEDMFTLLKTYLTNVSMEDICYIENYVLEYNIYGVKWTKEFESKKSQSTSYEYDYERLNDIRKKIICLIEDFKQTIESKKTAENIGKAIYENLVNNEIILNYEKQIEKLKEAKLDTKALEYSQVADKVVDVMDSLAKIYEEDNISYLKYKESFEFSVGEISVSSLPSFLDEVIICDISKSRVDSKKFVYIIGVNEGKLPKNISEDIMFSDDEIEKISNKGILFRKNSKAKLYMQMYNIHLAFKSAKEQLYLTYPASELNGATLRPSNIITLTKSILEKLTIQGNVAKEETNFSLDSLYSKQVAINNYLECASSYIKEKNSNKNENDIKEKYKEIAFSYKKFCKENNRVKNVLEYIRKDDNLSEESIKLLYNEELNTTVSRLEQYKKCAFSYFVKYGLKAKERKIYKLSSMDIGSFMHEIIEKVSKYLVESNTAWQEILINDEYIKIVDSVVEEVLKAKAYLFNNNSKNMLLKDKLIKSVKKVIKIIAQSFNQSKFIPLGYEIEFKNGGMYAPIEIKLDETKTMYITGKIDRVDIAKVNEQMYARVVDYKSSNKTLNLDDIKEGLSLQLITYMSAIINSKEKIGSNDIIPAGMLYFTLLNDVKHLKDYEVDNTKTLNKIKEAFRLKGLFLKDIEILEAMDKDIATDSKLIDASLSMKGTKYIQKDEFTNECKNISNILANIGRELLKGRVKILPNSKCKKTPCEYCKYIGICRKSIKK